MCVSVCMGCVLVVCACVMSVGIGVCVVALYVCGVYGGCVCGLHIYVYGCVMSVV